MVAWVTRFGPSLRDPRYATAQGSTSVEIVHCRLPGVFKNEWVELFSCDMNDNQG